MSYTPKYASNEKPRKKKRPVLTVILILLVAAAVAWFLLPKFLPEADTPLPPAEELQQELQQPAENETPEESDPVEVDPVEVDLPFTEFETPYCTLLFPSQSASYLTHSQTPTDNGSDEAFSMELDGKQVELFRICFGDATGEELLGVLETEQGEVPVTYTTRIFTETEFPDAESWNVYRQLMDGFSTMLNTIAEDPRFRQEQNPVTSEVQNVQLRHWAVDLPAGILVEETDADGIYRALFRGTVAGAALDLYAVTVGDTAAQAPVGTYTVNGAALPVAVDIFSSTPAADWTDEDTAFFYTMMDSINAVLQTIMADPAFTAA